MFNILFVKVLNSKIVLINIVGPMEPVRTLVIIVLARQKGMWIRQLLRIGKEVLMFSVLLAPDGESHLIILEMNH